jgi:hypothetical protein
MLFWIPQCAIWWKYSRARLAHPIFFSKINIYISKILNIAFLIGRCNIFLCLQFINEIKWKRLWENGRENGRRLVFCIIHWRHKSIHIFNSVQQKSDMESQKLYAISANNWVYNKLFDKVVCYQLFWQVLNTRTWSGKNGNFQKKLVWNLITPP